MVEKMDFAGGSLSPKPTFQRFALNETNAESVPKLGMEVREC